MLKLESHSSSTLQVNLVKLTLLQISLEPMKSTITFCPKTNDWRYMQRNLVNNIPPRIVYISEELETTHITI